MFETYLLPNERKTGYHFPLVSFLIFESYDDWYYLNIAGFCFKFKKKKKEQKLAVPMNGQETAHCLVGGPWGIFTLMDGS